MRRLIVLLVLGGMLAGCGDSPAPPTPVPALSPTPVPAFSPTLVPVLPPTPVPVAATPTFQGADSAGPSPAPATMEPPLVPAFPTSTVAFSGAGRTAGAQPFALRGGTYHVTWTTQPIAPAAAPLWQLGVAIHDPAGSSNYHQLLSVSVPSVGRHNGTVLVRDIPAGTYVLDADAAPTCGWSVSIAP